MPATFSAVTALETTRGPSPLAKAQGYRSLHGEVNYYPTSAHKRRPLREKRSAEGLTEPCGTEMIVSTSANLAGGSGTPPSSSGLSQTPSQGTPDISSLARRSSSQPWTPSKDTASIKSAPVLRSFTKGGAPLLHRYRTSCADVASRTVHGGTSSPLPPRDTISVSPEMRGKRPKNIRRSRLLTRPSATSEPHAARVSLREVDAETGAALGEPRTVSPLAQSLHRYSLSSPTRGGSPDSRVPPTRARLGAAHASSSSMSKRAITTPIVSSGASRQGGGKLGVAGAPLEREVCRGGKKHGGDGVSSSTQTHTELLPSRSVSTTLCSQGTDCMPTEASICGFIRMQRELRCCYDTIESYEVVIAQLRDDCTSARASLFQMRQEGVQHRKEVEAQVRAALSEQTSALLSTERRRNADEKSGPNTLSQSNGKVGDAAKECVKDTLQSTIEELRVALREEQSAHAESIARLSKTLAAKNRWKSRAVKLFKRQKLVCQRVLVPSTVPPPPPPPPPPSLFTAREGTISADEDCPALSAIGYSLRHPEAEADACLSAFQPHPLPQCFSCTLSPTNRAAHIASPSEAVKVGTTATTKIGTASSVVPCKEGVDLSTAHEKRERDDNSGFDMSVNFHKESTASGCSSSIATSPGRLPKAVGSGVVVVWPPFTSEQEAPTRKGAELAPLESSTKARSTEAEASATFGIGDGRLQPSSSTHLISPSAIPDGVVRYAASAAASRLAHDRQSLSRGCETTSIAADSLRDRPDPLAFPPPPMSGDVASTRCPSFCTPVSQWTRDSIPASMAPPSAERKFRELLRALLDKEQQLALMAEERAKYRRLYTEVAGRDASKCDVIS